MGQESESVQENLFIKQINLESLKNNVYPVQYMIAKKKVNALLITQIGNGNVLKIKANLNDYQVVQQIGNNNYYHFSDYYNSQKSNMKVMQEGSSNSLHVFGTNSLSKNIKITQRSNFKSVVVRNF